MSSHRNFRLVFSQSAWEAGVRPLLVDSAGYAAGPIRWNETGEASELLVDRLDVTHDLPQGSDRLPLTDWLVLTVQPDPGSTSAILQRISPRASQTVVGLVLNAQDRGSWEAVVHHEGTCFPVEEIQIVGPGMLRLKHAVETGEPGIPTDGRWSRTVGALGEALARKVRSCQILLIGCGRNGTQAAWQFAGLGVSRFTLIDPDQLESENLDAMPGLAADDIGLPKATALARRLIDFNPELSVRCLTQPVTDILSQLRSRFDLIVTCVDADAPRVAASWLSRELLVPHLDIGTSVQLQEYGRRLLAGDVRLLLPYAGCMHCVGGLADPEETLYEFAAPPGSMLRGEPMPWHAQRAGSLVHLNAVTVGVAVEGWLSLLRGQTGSCWQRLAWDTAGRLICDSAAVSNDPECPFCALPESASATIRPA